MDLRQVEFFVAVAEEQNFTRAATLTHVSQPGLSSSIRSLERELHAQLFDRTSHGVNLTPAGMAFLPHARRMLEDVAAMHHEVQAALGADGCMLRVGAEQCLGDLVDLADLLATFHELTPCVRLETMQSGAEDLVERLTKNQLDVVVVAERPHSSFTGLTNIELSSDGFEALTAIDHPLAALEQVSLAQLATYPLASLGATWSARQIVDEAFADELLAPRNAFTLSDVQTMFDVVRLGLAVAVVPSAVAAQPQAVDLARRPLGGVDLRWNVSVVLSSASPAAARTFAGMFVPGMALSDMRADLSRLT